MVVKTQSFTVQARVKVMASAEINAENWDDALQKAKELQVPDFVQPTSGQVFDDWDDFEITGIFK